MAPVSVRRIRRSRLPLDTRSRARLPALISMCLGAPMVLVWRFARRPGDAAVAPGVSKPLLLHRIQMQDRDPKCSAVISRDVDDAPAIRTPRATRVICGLGSEGL